MEIVPINGKYGPAIGKPGSNIEKGLNRFGEQIVGSGMSLATTNLAHRIRVSLASSQ